MPLPSLGRRSSRTDLKPVNPGRHRNSPAREAASTVEDHELTSYLAALAPESDPESTGGGRRFGEAQVFQLRMNLIASEQLKEIADARDLSPQALALEWVLERLNWESQAASSYDRQQQPETRRGSLDDEPHTDQFHFSEDDFPAEDWDPKPVSGRL
ncbi:hypothetical protein [Amycolatopsis suaedae]|uniref:hypothetical protein n=1 Tax=Amycolatopsis suaedae TaxID=2510978 RepID=UPI001F0E00D3|nr:hypothetical protein [Amycolatopsis suaedae]